MNEILQWTAVALAVALAVVVLIRRFRRESAGCGCGQCCDSCPYGAEFAQKCKDKP